MKFKTGDRVCAYDRGERFIGTIIRVQERIIHIKLESRKQELEVHPKQVRRLKKKENSRRKIYVSATWLKENYTERTFLPTINDYEWVIFDERLQE